MWLKTACKISDPLYKLFRALSCLKNKLNKKKSYLFFHLKPHAQFQNPRTTTFLPGWPRKKRKNNPKTEDTIFPLQWPRAVHALRLDLVQIFKFVNYTFKHTLKISQYMSLSLFSFIQICHICKSIEAFLNTRENQ